MNNSDLFGNFETNKNGKKNIKSIDSKIKTAKKIKTIAVAIGGLSPVALVLFIVLMALIGVLLPIFVVTTMVGGSTTYGDSKNDLPDDLTINGVDTWSDEEKKIFDDLTNEKQYYDNGFSVYNAGGILKHKDDELDISTPISTIHYQGTVNLTAFDDDYFDSVFNEDNSVNDYNDEKNVKNRHTRDFYKKAGEKLGNTFMIYPGMRMLLGNLVSNQVSFYVVEYDGHNAAEILSDWNLLGKIPSSNPSEAEGGAKYYYSPEKAIKNISRALSYGENNCSKDSWLGENICYDTELLYDEIFGGTLDNYTEDGIVKYLVEEYEAAIPTSFSDSDYGKEFIAVRVEKQLDYKLYEKYLKEIYIPYVYINCDDCGYRNDSQELKDGQAEKIFNEIMQLTNSFKKYNDEDLIKSSVIVVPGGFGHVVPSSGFAYLPEEYFSQMISPLVAQNGTATLSSCVGYYDAVEDTSYYCVGHDAADIVGGGGTIVAPADGVITYCSTNYGNWGPLLGITHTLKDKDGNDTKVISWYRHWVDLNGKVDCSTLYENRVVKKGESLAKESNQAGSYFVARHLHFKLTASDGTVYYIEDFLQSKGVNTSSANGTTDCDQVRRTCNEYCEDEKNGCTTTY